MPRLTPDSTHTLLDNMNDEVAVYLRGNTTVGSNTNKYEEAYNTVKTYVAAILPALKDALTRRTRARIIGALARYCYEKNSAKYAYLLRPTSWLAIASDVVEAFKECCKDMNIRISVLHTYLSYEEPVQSIVRYDFWLGFVNAKEYLPELFCNARG